MRAGRAHILELLRSLGPIAERVDLQCQQDGLLGEVRALLPVAERSHCLLAARRKDVLALSVDSAAWATRLRYRVPVLLAALQAREINSINIRIQPSGQSPVGAPSRSAIASRASRGRALSGAAASHLLMVAEEIAVPEIAEAFRRLARRRRAGEPSP
jgi:hypothetical protein